MQNIERAIENIKLQAEAYLLDAGEFFPFGVGISAANDIKPLSAYIYEENDRPPSLPLINLLERHVERELSIGNYLIAALAIDVTLTENNERYDALEIRIFEKNSTYKKHFKYSIHADSVAFCQI